MWHPRRSVILALIGGAGFLAVEPAALTEWLAQTTKGSPTYKPYPNGRDPNAPVTQDARPNPDPLAIQRANQVELRKDISKLYEMASELKEECDKTDPSATLSLSLVKKAEQIEKLAKQIKGLAKG